MNKLQGNWLVAMSWVYRKLMANSEDYKRLPWTLLFAANIIYFIVIAGLRVTPNCHYLYIQYIRSVCQAFPIFYQQKHQTNPNKTIKQNLEIGGMDDPSCFSFKKNALSIWAKTVCSLQGQFQKNSCVSSSPCWKAPRRHPWNLKVEEIPYKVGPYYL